jgi:uncharacterized protein YmfQ (DUF2313 family)
MLAEPLTQDESYDLLMALHPQGRAWQTHDRNASVEVSILRQFWMGVASVWASLETITTNMLLEFFCSTATTDLDLWAADYGLPDECDPFSEFICDKVTSGAGQDLAFYTGLAENIGFSATFSWLKGGLVEGGELIYDGVYSTLRAVVDSSESEVSFEVITLGTWALGLDEPLGTPPLTQLECVLARIVPAHIALAYEVI